MVRVPHSRHRLSCRIRRASGSEGLRAVWKSRASGSVRAGTKSLSSGLISSAAPLCSYTDTLLRRDKRPARYIQQREGHWAIVDLIGKGGHVRTIPVPGWVQAELSAWMSAANIHFGKHFRSVSTAGKIRGDGVSPKVVWHVVKEFAKTIGVSKLAPRA
jgi:hypothetical protein